MKSDEIISEYLKTKLTIWEAYHNHKENMSNAGFLIQISLFGSIVAEGLWPPSWVKEITDLPELYTFIMYFTLWFLVHYYTRWQLINKRVAAMYFSGFDSAYLYFINNEIKDKDMKCEHKGSHSSSKFKDFVNKVIYFPGGFQKMDATLDNIPDFIATRIQKKFDSGSGADTLEILITYTSITLMCIVATKIFFG